jgi:hypothetical protein
MRGASDAHAIVVITGPFALPRLTRHDLRTALSALGGQTLPDDPPTSVPDRTVNKLLHGFQQGFPRARAV